MRVYVRVDELIKELEHKADANAERGYMTAFDVIHECIEVVKAQPKVVVVEDVREEAYNRGLQDAWELANRLFGYSCDTKLTNEDLKKIFGSACEMDILRNFTPQEALAKLEAYEKEQNEIKVGDVVNIFPRAGGEYTGAVIMVKKDMCIDVIYSDGITARNVPPELYNKTDKHIDIQNILQQIGGVVDE